MQSNISLLIDSIRNASKFLHRDYSELESLQSSSKDTKLFVQRACDRVAENLQKSLSKYYKNVVFKHNVSPSLELDYSAIIPNGGTAALVEVLDGISNFQRAIPLFGLVVTILVKKNDKVFADKVAMNFPALGDIYYAEKGKGAWYERGSSNFPGGAFRLRVSANKKMEDILITCNYSEFELAKKLSSNIRMFESYAYQIGLLASGKSDCAIFQNREISTSGLELLIGEAGGSSSVQNGVFIGSNYELHDKVKMIL